MILRGDSGSPLTLLVLSNLSLIEVLRFFSLTLTGRFKIGKIGRNQSITFLKYLSDKEV